ncbi:MULTISPECIES: phosphoglycolate phosphatase [Proteus]|uniref:phosphoglycolate phosphatase n=1 Tax=Proteus TaxID=583 RepID=UPI00050869EF|nr:MULTISPECIES: phosphoglycolate phosphatase [Proteus]NBN61723.1 phosphoglycolate phosphatase [Proteus sp. G2639]KGA57888.1 phosphoglycolate phosphatase, bacterial [Proteus vulgaris]MBW3472456.1 phosphoglycolate phosphatase [Proteus vulgaris]NBN46104.1 phosphoglycolate phosphatase [Proteus sp. G2626]NBN75994.1 phosphoglycolate phosphatase [Proteus sp. G2615]
MTDKKLKGIRAIAFDLDGTLTDSAVGLTEATDYALKAKGFPPAGKHNVTIWVGNGVDMLLTRALHNAGVEDVTETLLKEMRDLFDAHYATSVKTGSDLFPHVKETLEVLASHNIPLGIVTNKPSPFIAPLLQQLGIDKYFSLVLGGDDVKEKKPHPAPLYLTMGTFGVKKEELLFVGDSRNDIIAAQEAQCPCVGLTYGYNYGVSIADSKPDYTLDNFADLLSILDITPMTTVE